MMHAVGQRVTWPLVGRVKKVGVPCHISIIPDRKAKTSHRGRTSNRIQAMSGGGMPPELKSSIDDFIEENAIVVFIKGTKEMPMCGFSNTVVQILNSMDVPYVSVNILDNDMLRAGMKEYSMWPTFPQVYIGGEFYGGCDIMIESYQRGELHEVVEIAVNS